MGERFRSRRLWLCSGWRLHAAFGTSERGRAAHPSHRKADAGTAAALLATHAIRTRGRCLAQGAATSNHCPCCDSLRASPVGANGCGLPAWPAEAARECYVTWQGVCVVTRCSSVHWVRAFYEKSFGLHWNRSHHKVSRHSRGLKIMFVLVSGSDPEFSESLICLLYTSPSPRD